jgi:hypothetical protein
VMSSLSRARQALRRALDAELMRSNAAAKPWSTPYRGAVRTNEEGL